jgi:hypothetical protein
MNQWHKCDVSEVALEFGADIKNGRSNVKPDRKRRSDNNIFLLPAVDSKSMVKKLMSDASVALLAIVYVLTSFLGYLTEAFSGLILLFAVFCVSFSLKSSSSKRSVNSYRLLLPGAKVIENGIKIRLSAFDVEVGDLIEFSQGDIIPADARIVFSENLLVAERKIDPVSGKTLYTRELKNVEVPLASDDNADTYPNLLYAASIVISGKGRAIVTETGADTKHYGNKSAMRIISDNDSPEYFSRFFACAKRTSLLAFMSVVPLTLLSLVRKSPVSADNSEFDLLYSFLLFLSVSVTCMSEFVISPAEFMITKELLISSRSDKAKKNSESRITKLSSAQSIADTDTVLVLTPDVLIDERNSVRRVLFADKFYRFDTLKSEDLIDFYNSVAPIVVHSNNVNLSNEMHAVKSFIKYNGYAIDFDNNSCRPKFLKNYPIEGARACVFESDNNGKPSHCTFYANNLTSIEHCTEFRTEGGGLWKIDGTIVEHIRSGYNEFRNVGLSPIIFISIINNRYIFEGMVAVGREYPFADGALAEEFAVSGIQTILFVDNEKTGGLTLARECGLIADESKIAVASEYLRNGLEITDAPITTCAYIGFDRSDVSKLTDRLLRNGRKILPIIKDSADRKGISQLSIYATHSTKSFDSIKISSSLSIQPVGAEERKGGIFDVLKMIRGASMARLKLGVYKNYLAFSMILRAVAICGSLLFGRSGSGITSLMILFACFFFDAIAVLSLMSSRGIPVKPKEAVSDSKVVFSATLFAFFLIAGIISGIALYAVTEILITVGKLPQTSATAFLMYSLMLSQVVSLGGFLVILNKRSRRVGLNWIYLTALLLVSAFMITQSFLPENLLNSLGLAQLSVNLIPFAVLCSLLSLLAVLLISGLLSSFADSNIKNMK